MAFNLPKAVVTPDDYKNMFGKDLSYILGGNDNDSNYPFTFLALVQDSLMDWCDRHGFRRIKFEELQGFQLQSFQKAVLYQAQYVWKNGAIAIGLESGIDNERGRVITPEDIEAAEVPPRVVNLLHKSGLFNLKIKNRPRITRGYPGVFGIFTGEDY